MLKKYIPTTTTTTPANPTVFGVSPSIIGDVISKNNGINEERGAISDNGDVFNAFKYRIRPITTIPPFESSATQNVWLIVGTPLNRVKGTKHTAEKKVSVNITIYSSKRDTIFLLKSSLEDCSIALDSDRRNQSMTSISCFAI